MSRYGIKAVTLSIVGEGARAGAKTVFVHFTGCNLWDGNPLQRDAGEGACASWCDADFAKGAPMDVAELLAVMDSRWPGEGNHEIIPATNERWCLLTGGEPCGQVNEELMVALHDAGWSIAIETNGAETNDAAMDADHIVWSPKLDRHGDPFPLAIPVVHEVKVVLPGNAPGKPGWSDAKLLGIEKAARDLWPGVPLFVQPQDPIVSSELVAATALVHPTDVTPDVGAYLEGLFESASSQCIAWVLAHPSWRLASQQRKFWGLP